MKTEYSSMPQQKRHQWGIMESQIKSSNLSHCSPKISIVGQKGQLLMRFQYAPLVAFLLGQSGILRENSIKINYVT